MLRGSGLPRSDGCLYRALRWFWTTEFSSSPLKLFALGDLGGTNCFTSGGAGSSGWDKQTVAWVQKDGAQAPGPSDLRVGTGAQSRSFRGLICRMSSMGSFKPDVVLYTNFTRDYSTWSQPHEICCGSKLLFQRERLGALLGRCCR